jgi:hypothetical protein
VSGWLEKHPQVRFDGNRAVKVVGA